jgi:SpoVK/Ycf46/Vps4 family AAA+-type ATPase
MRSHGREKRPFGQYQRLVPLGIAPENKFSQFVEIVEPRRLRDELILSEENIRILAGIIDEFRHADDLRRHALSIRTKMLFCGPPGCGKTMTAEVFANELKLPLFVARLDGIITSFLGETASNLRKTFEAAEVQSCVLFLDEFDALARARSDLSEHGELRRVVNSLLMMIDRFKGRSFIIAATNLEQSLDSAVWRRFDEVVLFKLPKEGEIRRMLRLKTRNFKSLFSIEKKALKFRGFSYADIERVCQNAIKRSILKGSRNILESEFDNAVREERNRQSIQKQLVSRPK